VFSENFADPYTAFSTTIKDGVLSVHPLAGIALFSALGVAMIGSLFSSDAWNNVTFIAGEVKEPHKNIPLGLFIGTAIVTVIYILANLAYLMVLPVKGDPTSTDVLAQGLMFAQNDRVGTAALYLMFGDVSKYLMAALIMISTFGCNNGLILAGSRLFQSMANDGLFFKRAASLNKALVPGKALYLQALWASVLCLSGSYGDLLDYATFASLVFYIVTISGLFILRKKEPNTPRPYKAFGYPFIPALYILLAGVICIDLLFVKTFNTGMGVLMILLGTLVFRFFKPVNKN
jgi:APA family basic amino acid/polyamine antiporter